MTTQRAIQDEHSPSESHPFDASEQSNAQPQVSIPLLAEPSAQSQPEETFFLFEDEEPCESHVVAPFQRSHAMPTITAPDQQSANLGPAR